MPERNTNAASANTKAARRHLLTRHTRSGFTNTDSIQIGNEMSPIVNESHLARARGGPACYHKSMGRRSSMGLVGTLKYCIEPKTVSHSGSQGVVPAGQRVEIGDAKRDSLRTP